MAREERPTRDTPLEFWAVLMEGVLRQRVGRPIVMHDQLQHLADLAEHLNITVQERRPRTRPPTAPSPRDTST
ncbi:MULTISPECIES: Scr1 family TA system antitoxin-like transcriptional regulator [unclassified Streptomyces]|uniref:Scr1 family TA system antitoxin-like transcriptional regulator n=1 Tax=unclassified Streptomyces TaxID=2593676 RepID=UPI0033B5289B